MQLCKLIHPDFFLFIHCDLWICGTWLFWKTSSGSRWKLITLAERQKQNKGAENTSARFYTDLTAKEKDWTKAEQGNWYRSKKERSKSSENREALQQIWNEVCSKQVTRSVKRGRMDSMLFSKELIPCRVISQVTCLLFRNWLFTSQLTS